jgi:hypothetical protein
LIGGAQSTNPEKITLGVCGWEGNEIVKYMSAKEDLVRQFPEGHMEKICAVREK